MDIPIKVSITMNVLCKWGTEWIMGTGDREQELEVLGAYMDYEWFWLSKRNMRVQTGELGKSGWAPQAHQVTAALQSPQDPL